jgi:hypothetical protein
MWKDDIQQRAKLWVRNYNGIVVVERHKHRLLLCGTCIRPVGIKRGKKEYKPGESRHDNTCSWLNVSGLHRYVSIHPDVTVWPNRSEHHDMMEKRALQRE